MKNLALLFFLVARSVVLHAQTNEATLVIRGGTLVDVKSGNEIPDSVIVVRGERIEHVGEEGKVEVPAGARTIDA